MKERLFRFKQFSVCHSRSAMKVGVDGVLLGAWARIDDCQYILDAGSGCGLIALMCAQRNGQAHIHGIDIDPESVKEATDNALASPWAERLSFITADFSVFTPTQPYDHIISNPPFFDAGVSPETLRETARHSGSLDPIAVIRIGVHMLSDNGRISLISPPEWEGRLLETAGDYGLSLSRRCLVRGNAGRPFKRMLTEFSRLPLVQPEISELTLEEAPGIPTELYRQLCAPFYLRF